MRTTLIGVLIGILIIIASALMWQKGFFTEAFSGTSQTGATSQGPETVESKIQDRGNILASQQHPLTNPSAAMGIAKASGADLRRLAIRALNPDIQVPGSSGAFNMNMPYDKASPRIDNENSFLGIVKFCKNTVDTAVKNHTLTCSGAGVVAENEIGPFTDADFKKYCGVLIPNNSNEVTLITGEKFTGPTGVVVYQEDKDIAIQNQINNNYRYPRALPSLNSATTIGLSLTDDSRPPILAINSVMLNDMICRNNCRTRQDYATDGSCGRCIYGGSSPIWSYVKKPPYGDINGISLVLIGNGMVTVDVNSHGPVTTSASGTATQFKLSTSEGSLVPLGNTTTTSGNLRGYILEGDTFKITVKNVDAAGTSIAGSTWVAGVIQGINPDGSINYLDLWDTLSSDSSSNGAPKRGTGTGAINYPMPQSGPGSGYTSNVKTITNDPTVISNPKMILNGEIPFTFVSADWDSASGQTQIGYYDCTSNPYVTSQSDFDQLGADDCSKNPPGQNGTVPYSVACLQGLILAAGCSTAGDWWKTPKAMPGVAGNANKSDIISWLRQHTASAATNVQDGKGCYGIDNSTACDAELADPTLAPSDNCLTALYNNAGQGKSIGTSYNTENFTDARNYRALNNQTDVYCRAAGSLNPANGDTTLKTVWTAGYTDPNTGTVTRGMQGVKNFLSATYNSALDTTRDINSPNNAATGGRRDDWASCFGLPIAPIPTNQVTRNIIGTGTPPASFLEECPPYTAGQNVYECVEVASADSLWKGMQYETSAPPTGNGVMWIWGSQAYKTSEPSEDYTFRTNFCNPYGANSLNVMGGIDNVGWISVNGVKYFDQMGGGGGTGIIQISFIPFSDGINKIAIYGKNVGPSANPAGVWLAIKGPDGSVIAATNSVNWRCIPGEQSATW